MKRICVIGAGVVGSVAAYYLSDAGFEVDVYDTSIGQATSAAVGIICPWVSQRRNKVWYQLVEDGAKFYHQLVDDIEDPSFYTKSGSLHLHKNLEKLYQLALKRQETAHILGSIEILKGDALKPYVMEGVHLEEALYIEGAACVDGKGMVNSLLSKAQQQGAKLFHQKVSLDNDHLQTINGIHYDHVIVAAGAWINQVFEATEYQFDVYPQKGQLIEYPKFFDINEVHYPFIIPQGELDIMFDLNGSLIIGASHENDKGFDLEPDPEVLNRLHSEASDYLPFLKEQTNYQSRVGTRAHSSSFNPFYGVLPNDDTISVASALGSSGLTSGPLIGYRLAQSIIHSKPIEHANDISDYLQDKSRDSK